MAWISIGCGIGVAVAVGEAVEVALGVGNGVSVGAGVLLSAGAGDVETGDATNVAVIPSIWEGPGSIRPQAARASASIPMLNITNQPRCWNLIVTSMIV
jgi:hypothetical protein